MRVPPLLLSLGWNRRPLAFTDFEDVCAALGVSILRAPVRTPGMYFECRGRPIITLSSRLHGVRLWFVAWHELAHVLCHAPGLRCFSPGYVNKAEAEAEAIAACAVLDEETLYRVVAHGELHDFPHDIMRLRLRVLERRGV